MNDKEFNAADQQVISMVNRGRGPGGELPCYSMTFIPSDRADRVTALDNRIQAVKKVMPLIVAGAVSMTAIFLAYIGWLHGTLAALIMATSFLQGMMKYRRGL